MQEKALAISRPVAVRVAHGAIDHRDVLVRPRAELDAIHLDLATCTQRA